MKTFIYKTLTFVAISISLIFAAFIFTNYLIDRSAKFKLAPVNNVIIGHSHSECAFNDSIINDFRNLSQSRQSYFYSFQKIKKVISQNRNVKNVFVEFSNNQINAGMDNWIWDDLSISSRSLYLPFLDKEDIDLLWNKNPKGFISASSKSFRNNTINLLLLRSDYSNKIGGYKWLNRFKTDSLVTAFKKDNLVLGQKTNSISNKNIEYLEKIVAFCRANKVNIFFIRSPQNILLDSRKNEKEFMTIKNEKFENIEFLDFNDFPLKNNEFGDFGHLNYKGAEKFSLWFNGLLDKELLLKSNKNEFVLNEIKYERTTKAISNAE